MANYLLLLGSAQERAGQWEAAKQSLERANSLFPNSAIILNFLGYSQLERRENVDVALDLIRTAYRLQSNSPAITDSLGWGLFLTGEHSEAVPLLEKAQLGQPDDPTINEHLGDAYWQVGRVFEARYAWRSARLFAEADSHARLDAKIDIGLTEATISP
jgi:Flp pilus assembly protein TadD